ncbi:phosphate ABC transporter permease PstA [Parascardovia denticolens]|uniref:phosphate ABC transporter permease PstA n=1 Tax=Parascardovia denticolens TaxID=78258 RepID=UPI003CD0DB48
MGTGSSPAKGKGKGGKASDKGQRADKVDKTGADQAAAPISSVPKPDFDKFTPTRSSLAGRKRFDRLMTVLIYTAFIIALIPLVSVLWTTVSQGAGRFNWYFLTHNMRGVVGGLYPYGGILHAMVGTVEITLAAMVISIPIGVMASVYLVEYSHGGRLARAISFFVDVMSGIPSIVAGLFAYSFFSILLGPGTVNGLVGAVALSILMIPTVVRSTQEMLQIVPTDLREASYALGVTRSRTIVRVVLRTALPGIISGAILAIARVIGETAPLLIAAGFISSTNANLFSGRMTTLPVYVYNEYSQGLATCLVDAQGAVPPTCVASIRMERAWAAALALILLVLVLNAIGRLVARAFAPKGSAKS